MIPRQYDSAALLLVQAGIEFADERFGRPGGAGGGSGSSARFLGQSLGDQLEARQRHRGAAGRHEKVTAIHAVGLIALGALDLRLLVHAISPEVGNGRLLTVYHLQLRNPCQAASHFSFFPHDAVLPDCKRHPIINW
jgi:hypothetical protein